MLRSALVIMAAGFGADSAGAEEFSAIQSRDAFVGLIEGRELTRFGISLNVTPEGEIIGRAFGTPVTGQWSWEGAFFCRDLYYGQRDLGANCQLVEINGDTLRFTTDRGDGIYADLRLQ